MRWAFVISLLIAGSGCQLIPEIAHQPVVHNPFPQLSKVAIAPFFNLSAEPSVDGRQFAQAYFNELQLIPGYEVVPVGVVEQAMQSYQLSLNNPDEVRKLAAVLGVDVIVIGAVTDFTPYYPPRVTMQVEWYAANPCFQQIPPGYGLPWGTPEEEFIPAPLALEAEMSLARAQLRTQTPPYATPAVPLPPPGLLPQGDDDDANGGAGVPSSHRQAAPRGKLAAAQAGAVGGAPASEVRPAAAALPAAAPNTATDVAGPPSCPTVPPYYPDARAFIPAPPGAAPCPCQPTVEPVMRHTKTYNGNDAQLTEALASYAFFKDEARGAGWQSYLQRSDDFIRFCCNLHIYEMLSARGGAGQTRVVWRWSNDRYLYR